MTGTATSPTLTTMLRAAISAAHPAIQLQGRDKDELLEDVRARHGWTAVLAIGAQVSRNQRHPLVRALVASPNPLVVLARWQSLERFAHSEHRVRLVGTPARDCFTVVHERRDGGKTAEVSDLFVWGLLHALTQASGARDVTASLGSHALWPHRPAAGHAPGPTRVATFHWQPGDRAGEDTPLPTDAASTQERLGALLRDDLLVRWSVDDAARRLGMSARSFQRALRLKGTSFSQTVQQTRVEAAEALVADRSLSLTEIAFCTGFADHGHFTRTFRRHADAPPSALREALTPEARR